MAPPPLGRSEGLARIRLYRSAGVGPAVFGQLLERFGSAQAAVANIGEWNARRTRPVDLADMARVEDEIAAVRALGGRYLFHDRPDYPPMLAMAENAPPVLIAKGRSDRVTASGAVALVGARNASAGSCRLAWGWAKALAEAGHVVVSGLARGIDGAAHEGALAAENGAGTIGVLPGGLDQPYPPEHAALIERVGAEGLLLTAMPPGVAPTERHFPARNRLIAGLAAATVVVEAAYKSGSLMTARMAAEQGREVAAVPGSPLDPRAHGGNAMIREGAVLVQRVEDIIELITGFTGEARSHWLGGAALEGEEEDAPPVSEAPAAERPAAERPAATPPAEAMPLAERLYGLLSPAPLAIDELVRAAGASAGAVQIALVELELDGRLTRHLGGKVSRAP